jgi:hypothetical protein
MKITDAEFAVVHSEVCAWAERVSSNVLSTGVALGPSGCNIATAVGVKHPELVRVLFVDSIPYPENPVIQALAREVGMIPENTGGMTLAYAILVLNSEKQNRRLLAHELRHVAQYEACGAISRFMDTYLRELLHFEYGPGPFEVDAQSAEARYA